MFSVAFSRMNEEERKKWLDRIYTDGEIAFWGTVVGQMEEDVLEGKEKEWAEYQAAGVTVDGKNYYYQGQLVNVFLDVRSTDRAFYTLNINPKGTVNIRIIREEDEAIIGVAYLTYLT